MPDEKLSVQIEASLDKQSVRNVEKDLSDVGKKPIKLDISVDDAIKRLNKKIADLNHQITFSYNNDPSNLNGLYKQYKNLQWAQSHITENKDAITIQDLQSILESVNFTLSDDTISTLSETDTVPEIEIPEINTFADAVNAYNALVKIQLDDARAGKGKNDRVVAGITEISNKLDSMMPEWRNLLSKNGQINATKANAAYAQIGNKDEGESKSGGSLKKIVAGLVGIRSLFMLVRRIASNNEKLTSAVTALISTLSNILQPILDYLATFINTIAYWLAKLFGVSTKTEKSSASTATNTKSLANFDEINNLSSSSAASAGTTEPGVWSLEDFITQLEALALVIGTIAAIVATVTTIVTGAAVGIPVVIGAAIALVVIHFQDLFNIVTGLIQAVVGVAEAIVATITTTVLAVFEGGVSLITAVFKGLWDGISTLIKTGSVKQAWNSLWDSFKTTISKMWDNMKTTLFTPWQNALNSLYNTYIKPGLQKILNGLGGIVNGFIKAVNSVVGAVNKIPGVKLSTMPLWSVPKLSVGTNYVAQEGLAYLHQSEAVIPAKYNGAWNENVTKSLDAIMQALDNQGDVVINIDGAEVGRASVNYMNKQSRLLNGSVI